MAASTCFEAPDTPEDRRTNKDQLVVGSFNAEWLFLEYYSASKCPGTGCPWKNISMAENHLAHIASVIKSINVDILVLVEVENCDVLATILQEIGDSSYRYYLKKGTDTATGQNVGLITRVDPVIDLSRTEDRADFPVKGSKCGSSGSGDSGVSKHFYSRFKVDNLDRELVVIGTHLIAFPDVPDRCSQREAQATVLQQLAQTEARDHNRHLIIMGDLNDYDNTFADAAGNKAISMVLEILRSDTDDNTDMVNVASEISTQSQRWSCWYDMNSNCKDTPNEHTLIDHVLMDSDLSGYISSVNIPHNLFSPGCNSYYSDHWPITVTLSLD